MLLLTSTNDLIRVITSDAGTVDVHASWVDLTSGTTVTPGRTNTNISTADTTPVVGSPGSGVQRNVKILTIRNSSLTVAQTITVTHFDGTTSAELFKDILPPRRELIYTEDAGFFYSVKGVQITPDWHGQLYACYGRCDPQQLLRMATMAGTAAATPTNISTTVARCSYFRPPADITVNTLRFYGVGSTSSIYHAAIYRSSDLARLTSQFVFSTSANAWGVITTGLGLTLTKDTLYFMAVGVGTTSTTTGMLGMAATTAATTGQIQSEPLSWPGNLSLNANYMDGGFAQYATTSGALTDPAGTLVFPAAWTGGFPLIFLDAA